MKRGAVVVGRVEVQVSPGDEIPAVCVVSGRSSSAATAFWVRGRPLHGLLPGRGPSKWIDLPVNALHGGIVIMHRFLVGMEVFLVLLMAGEPAAVMAGVGADVTAVGLLLLLVVFFEVLRRLVGRRIPRVESLGAGGLLIRRAHPDFAGALGTDSDGATHGPA